MLENTPFSSHIIIIIPTTIISSLGIIFNLFLTLNEHLVLHS